MILITGGSGFLGKKLIAHFIGYPGGLRILSRSAQPNLKKTFPSLDIATGNLCDPAAVWKALEGVTHIIHAGALVSIFKKDSAALHRTNVVGTRILVDLALQKDIKKLVYVSSVAALGRNMNGLVDETHKWSNSGFHTYYGYTKHLGGLEVYRGIAEGLPAVLCYPSLILGYEAGDSGSSVGILDVAYKQIPFVNSGSSGVVSVYDVVKGIGLLLDSQFVSGEKFLLTAENWSYKNLLSEIAAAMSKKVRGTVPPYFLIKQIGRFGDFLARIGKNPIPLSLESAILTSMDYNYDGSKICDELGMSYRPIKEVIKESALNYVKAKAK